MQFLAKERHLRVILVALIAIILLSALNVSAVFSELQRTNISLSFNTERPLRGEVLKVSGRLSTVEGDLPIPLVNVRLQYHRAGETDLFREVTTVTSNPGGTFEDLVNTTYLLRIGTWVVNASFADQVDYQDTFTVRTFTVVVQPDVSLYISAHTIALGKSVTFNGLLFACIPCIQDQVTIIFTRPDNSSVIIVLPITATGGPYPGGYYEGTFTPDTAGQWFVRAVWRGNDVTLPAYSQVERVSVEAPLTAVLASWQLIGTLMIVAAIVLVVFFRRRQAHEAKRKLKGSSPTPRGFLTTLQLSRGS